MPNSTPIPAVFSNLPGTLHGYFGIENSTGYLREDHIHQLVKHHYNPDLDRAGIAWLSDYGYFREFVIDTGTTEERMIKCWELTPGVAEYLYDYFTNLPSVQVDNIESVTAQFVPAADRFVSIDHNTAEFSATQSALDELAAELRSSNEFSGDSEEREPAIIEVQAVKTLISKSRVRHFSVWAAAQVTGSVGWLSKEVGSSTIRALANAAVAALPKLVGLL